MGRFYVVPTCTNSGQINGYLVTDDATEDKTFGSENTARAYAAKRNAEQNAERNAK